jgi:hypothetical protein
MMETVQPAPESKLLGYFQFQQFNFKIWDNDGTAQPVKVIQKSKLLDTFTSTPYL